MADIIYAHWKGRKLLVEKGVPRKEENFTKWSDYLAFDEEDGGIYSAYLSAGIKSFLLAKEGIDRGLSPKEIVNIKQSFMEKGIQEEHAEVWTYLHLYNPELVKVFLERGIYEPDLAELLVQDRLIKRSLEEKHAKRVFNVQDLKKVFELFERQEIDRPAMLKEMKYFIKTHNCFALGISYDGFLENYYSLMMQTLQEIKSAGFKSPVFAFCFRYSNKQKNLKMLKERKNFYLSLGLDELWAEWWTGHEFRFNALDVSDEEIQKLFSQKELKTFFFSLRSPLEVYRFFFILEEEPWRLQEKEEFLSAFQWAKDEFFPYWNRGPSLEKVQRWAEFKLSPEKLAKFQEPISPKEFRELLEKSCCSPEELFEWLEEEGFQKVQSWFELGIKDRFTSKWLLRDYGINQEKLKNYLSLLNIEEVLKILSEGGLKELQKEYERRLLPVYKQTIRLFKRR